MIKVPTSKEIESVAPKLDVELNEACLHVFHQSLLNCPKMEEFLQRMIEFAASNEEDEDPVWTLAEVVAAAGIVAGIAIAEKREATRSRL